MPVSSGGFKSRKPKQKQTWGVAKWLSATGSGHWDVNQNWIVNTVVNVRLPKCSWIGSVVTVGIALSILLTGCPDPSTVVGVAAGCRREYGGVTGIDRPETSGLSCAAIDELTSATPSEPEAFLSTSDSPRLLWKCRFDGWEARRVLLRCEHGKHHFSIINGR